MGRYICEISPARHRGVLTTGPQLCVSFGILAGFFTCYGTARIETDLCWRLPFILLAICAATFSAATFLLLPPSPRWLEDQGRSKPEIAAAWAALEIKDTDQGATSAEDTPPADVPVATARKGFNVGAPAPISSPPPVELLLYYLSGDPRPTKAKARCMC